MKRKKKDLKNLGESLQTETAGNVVIVSVPGAENPWFVYDKKNRKSSQGFKTLKAAERYLKSEFKK